MSTNAEAAGPGRVVTLGQFIIDQFEHRDVETGEVIEDHHPEQIGGGGTYAIVGARLFLPAAKLGMVVDVGSDFPLPMRTALERFGQAMWWFRPRTSAEGESELTTRALNIYAGEERGEGYQSFRYLTARKRISPAQLPSSPFVGSEADGPPSYLHFVCGPERAEQVVSEVAELNWSRTGLVWEPMPPDCTPANRPAITAASVHMTILSPNHLEALALLGLTPASTATGQRKQIEDATRKLASWLVMLPRNGAGRRQPSQQQRAAVIRAGPEGVCFALASAPDSVRWLPAVFGEADQARVKDVTGGGNAFLGGLCAGLSLTGGDAYRAILYGSVAASFAIEQAGLPSLASADDSAGTELWNSSESGLARLARYERAVEGAAVR